MTDNRQVVLKLGGNIVPTQGPTYPTSQHQNTLEGWMIKLERNWQALVGVGTE